MDFEKMLKEEMRTYQTKFNQVEMNYFYKLEAVKEKCALKIAALENRVEEITQEFMLKLNRAEMGLNDALSKEYETYVKNEDELARAFEQEKITELPQAMKKIERLFMAKKVIETKMENAIKDANLMQSKLAAIKEQNDYVRKEIVMVEEQRKQIKSAFNSFIEVSKLPDAHIEQVKKWAAKDKFSKIVEKFAAGELFTAKTLENIAIRIQGVREKVSELAMHTIDKDASQKLYKVLADLMVEDIVQNSELQIIISLPEELKRRFSLTPSNTETPKNIEQPPKKNAARKPKPKPQAPPAKLSVDAPTTDRSPSPTKNTREILESRMYSQRSSKDESKSRTSQRESRLNTPAANVANKSPFGVSELISNKMNFTILADDIDKEIERRMKEVREHGENEAVKEVPAKIMPVVNPVSNEVKEIEPIPQFIPSVPEVIIKTTSPPRLRETPKGVPPINISKKPELSPSSKHPSESKLDLKSSPLHSSPQKQEIDSEQLLNDTSMESLISGKYKDEDSFSVGRSEAIQVEINKIQDTADSNLGFLSDKRTTSRQTLHYKPSRVQLTENHSADLYSFKNYDKSLESLGANQVLSLDNLKATVSNIITESSRTSSRFELPDQRAAVIKNSVSKVMNSEIAVGDESYKIAFVVNWFIENYFKETIDSFSQTDRFYELNDEPRIHNYMSAIRGILMKNMKERSNSRCFNKRIKSKESPRDHQTSLSGAKIDQYFRAKNQFEGDYKFHTKSESSDGMRNWLQTAALRTAVAYEEYKAEFKIEARRLGIKKIELKDVGKIWQIVIRRRLREGEGDDISVYLRGFQGTDKFDSEIDEIIDLLSNHKKNEMIQKIQRLPGRIHTMQEEQQQIHKQRKPLVLSRWRDLILKVSASYARKMGREQDLDSNLLEVWYEMARNIRYVADRIAKLSDKGFPHLLHKYEKKSSDSYKGWNVSNSPNVLQRNKNVKQYTNQRRLKTSLSVTPSPEELRHKSKSGVRTSTDHKVRSSTKSEERRVSKKIPDFLISSRFPEIQREKS
jgi:hypothetical protein